MISRFLPLRLRRLLGVKTVARLPAYQLIDRQDQLAPLLAALDRVDEVALDTEADNLFRYRTAVCLLQIRAGTEIFHALKSVLKGRGLGTAVGDEGGFAPSVKSHEAAIQLILQAIEKAGYAAGYRDRNTLNTAAVEAYAGPVFDLGRFGLASQKLRHQRVAPGQRAQHQRRLARGQPRRGNIGQVGEHQGDVGQAVGAVHRAQARAVAGRADTAIARAPPLGGRLE